MAASPFTEMLPNVVLEFRRRLLGIGNTSKRSSGRLALCRAAMVLLAIASATLLCLPAHAQTYVPPVVASSVSTVPVPTEVNPTGNQVNFKSPAQVAVDACGNIY